MAHGLRNGGGLRGGRLRSKEDTDPMASVANIADIMLVFACGLMMALVTVWNIDFTPPLGASRQAARSDRHARGHARRHERRRQRLRREGHGVSGPQDGQVLHGHRGQRRDGQRPREPGHLVGRFDELQLGKLQFQLIEFKLQLGQQVPRCKPLGFHQRERLLVERSCARQKRRGGLADYPLPSFISNRDTSRYTIHKPVYLGFGI